MKKIKIEAKIKYDYCWEYENEIDLVIEDLNKMKELGATHISIETEESWGCATITFESHCERMETNEEAKERLDKIQSRKNATKMNDLNTIELLKKRHGIK